MVAPPPARSYYQATARPVSFPPLPGGEVRADVCVVGGGLTGVSAALELAERGFDVRLIDAGEIGGGATARNGGQINFGLAVGALGLLQRFDRSTAQALFQMAEEAIRLIDRRVERYGIDCDLVRGFTFGADKHRQLRHLAEEFEALQTVYGIKRMLWLDEAAIRARVATMRFRGGIHDPGSGHIHTLNYCLGLAEAALAAGAGLHPHVTARRVDPETGVVETEHGRIRADHVLVAANAYLDGLLGPIDGYALPVGTWVMATAPLSSETCEALIPGNECVCDANAVLDYFRFTADNRLLFGGGVSYLGRESGAEAADLLRRRAAKTFPTLSDVPVDYVWGGRVSITRSRLPHLGRVGTRVYFAHGFSGQGVALTGLAGKLIAEAIAGEAGGFDVFSRISHTKFPGGRHLRRPLVTLGRLWYRLMDVL